MIRPAHSADRNAILQLATEFATSFAVSEPAFSAAFAAVVNAPEVHLAVADVDGQLVGYVLAFRHPTFFANGPVAWVEELMVDQRYRRQGLGQQLMASVEDWASGAGCRLVALATRRAAAFYSAIGYAESATYFRKLL